MKDLLTFIYGALLIIFGVYFIKVNFDLLSWKEFYRIFAVIGGIMMLFWGFNKIESCTHGDKN